MNSHVDRAFHEGGRDDPEQRLDQLLARHRTELTSTVAGALDTSAGNTALAPLRRELFHGLQPLKLTSTADGAPQAGTPDLASAGARLERALTQLRDIRLMVERVQTGATHSTEVYAGTQSVLATLQCLHTALQARNLSREQARVLFRELREQTARTGTSMLGLLTTVPQHLVEEWLRATGRLQNAERTVWRLFRSADNNVTSQG